MDHRALHVPGPERRWLPSHLPIMFVIAAAGAAMVSLAVSRFVHADAWEEERPPAV